MLLCEHRTGFKYDLKTNNANTKTHTHTTALLWLCILFSNSCQEELHLKWEDWQKSAWCIQHLMSGGVNGRHRAYAVPCEIPSPAHYDYSPSCSSALPLFSQAHRIYQSKALTTREKGLSTSRRASCFKMPRLPALPGLRHTTTEAYPSVCLVGAVEITNFSKHNQNLHNASCTHVMTH